MTYPQLIKEMPDTGVITRFKELFVKHADKTLVSDQPRVKTRPLGLTVAQRTDVGRKRQHNEDSVAYIIPKDQQLLMQKGALFIVADGMGGHAAGEVASEIAVDTVCTLYYQDPDTDIPTSLTRAIQYANVAIYQRPQRTRSIVGWARRVWQQCYVARLPTSRT